MISSVPALAEYTPTTPYGTTMKNLGSANYLIGAADAWASVVPGWGANGLLTSGLAASHVADIPLFKSTISLIAYNDSALTIFEINKQIENGFLAISNPLSARRTDCVWSDGRCDVVAKSLIIDIYAFGGFSKYDSDDNAAFETMRASAALSAKIYLTDGFVLGAGFGTSWAETDDTRAYADIYGSSFTLFAQYLSRDGFFINGGAMIGQNTWDSEKSIASISNTTDYYTNFYSGQISTGVKMEGHSLFFTPQLGARYAWMKTLAHTDRVLQQYDAWDYGVLTGMAEMRFGANIVSGDIAFRPSVLVGGGYDIITDGDDTIGVTLINNSVYEMPVETPDPWEFNAGVGFGIRGGMFEINLDYILDWRQNFMAHTGMLNLKLMF